MSSEAWLADVTDDPPCGPDLEYDPAFLALLQSATGKPEQQYGDTVIPAEAPDWREVEQRASALLGRSKDLRIVAALARAELNVRGITGLADAVHLARELLERHWDEVHPRAIVDGESDPLMRLNAVGALADPTGIVLDLRQAVLLQSAIGPITVRQAEACLGGTAGSEGGRLAPEQLRGAMRDALVAGQPAPRALQAMVADLRAIDRRFREHFGAEQVPDFGALLLPAETIGKLTSSIASSGGESGEVGTSSEPAGPLADSGTRYGAGVSGREEALRALDRVCEYLERNEPSNPAPLLIRRAQRLMTMNFVDIIRDLAPESLGQVELITGARQTDG